VHLVFGSRLAQVLKPLLVVGLGNPLMGDDGVGWHVVESLAADPRFPSDAEVIFAGTDLLRCAGRLEERRRVVLIDAVQDGAVPGTVTCFGGDLCNLETRGGGAHQLSAIDALGVLRAVASPPEFTLIGITVAAVSAGEVLSPALSARLPVILDEVLLVLARG